MAADEAEEEVASGPWALPLDAPSTSALPRQMEEEAASAPTLPLDAWVVVLNSAETSR